MWEQRREGEEAGGRSPLRNKCTYQNHKGFYGYWQNPLRRFYLELIINGCTSNNLWKAHYELCSRWAGIYLEPTQKRVLQRTYLYSEVSVSNPTRQFYREDLSVPGVTSGNHPGGCTKNPFLIIWVSIRTHPGGVTINPFISQGFHLESTQCSSWGP